MTKLTDFCDKDKNKYTTNTIYTIKTSLTIPQATILLIKHKITSVAEIINNGYIQNEMELINDIGGNI